MRKIFLLIAIIASFAAAGQTPFPLYIPTNPDSLRIPVNLNGATRTVYNIDLVKYRAALSAHDTATALRLLIDNKADKAGTISINGNTQTLGSNPSFTVSGSGGSADTASLSSRINRKLRVYNVEDYGAVHDGVTNDQAAIQAAINACHAAGGGTVYLPNGVYILGSALDATSGAQLYIPLSTYNRTDTLRVIRIFGETSPNQYSTPLVDVTSNQKMPTTGVVLQSTLQGSTGAIIGSRSQSVSWGTFSFSELQLENITTRAASRIGTTNTAATQTAIDGSKLAFISLKNVRVDVQPASDSIVTPASTSVGINMPKVSNFAFTTLDNVMITGYYKAMIVSEHNVAHNVMIDGCYIGLSLEGNNYHGNQFDRLGIYRTVYNIRAASGQGQINISELAIEDKTTGTEWFVNLADLDETGGTWQGNIKFARVVTGIGISNGGFKRTGTGTSLIRTTDITGTNIYHPSGAQNLIGFLETGSVHSGYVGRVGSTSAAVGALSPNDVYLYSDQNVELYASNGGAIRMIGGNGAAAAEHFKMDAGTGNATFGSVYAGQKFVTVTNTSTNAAGQAIFSATNGSSSANYGITGPSYTTYGALISNAAYLYSPGGNGLTFMADNSAAPIKFAVGGNVEKMRLANTGNLLLGTTTDNSKLTVAGSVSFAYVAKTANYTATASDYTIDCNGTFTVTLPTAAGITGRIYVIKNSGAGTVTLAGTGAQTFDGATSPTIATQYGILRIQSNGANWILL